ncbi:glycoside hydrolase family 92 protein [Niveomyces insectorum RCEF 264]|uniref:Glycoside hydrolase family 92 protein n=1 Tax=Niveomyces insectorum RCEF 264 TaxID=1081102 RepID=A0A162IG19_9HYPO|nr:glycoside hydrolase family 92 protein [Niveomyces insectorum RCEF 264]
MAMPAWFRVCVVLGAITGVVGSTDYASYVLPLTGSEAGGNIFPGVSEPLGMVKLGPDMDGGPNSRGSSYSGYAPGGAFFTGFSMLHESGTGGAPKYGVVSQMPVVGGPPANPLSRQADQRGAAPDVASPGAYTATLASGIVVDLAAASRAGVLQYTFPSGDDAPVDATTARTNNNNSIIVDVSHYLPAPDRAYLSQHYRGGNITVTVSDDHHLQYEGAGTYDNGWNLAPPWTVYFCGRFDQPGTAQTFLGKDGTGDTLAAYSAGATVASPTARLGAVFTFDGRQNGSSVVTARVGVSFVSAAQACRNVDEQAPAGTTQAALAAQTRAKWNADTVLGRATTTDTANTTRLQLLYTSMYHMLLMPQNKTGENPLWTSSEPYYDDIFTLWDLFRCTTALLHVLQPVAYEEFLRSLVDIWRHEGFLPDARSSFFSGATQGGSNADNVLADAYVKGVRGRIDWADAYAAMRTDAETVPPPNHDPRDQSGSTKQGRGALPDWKAHGFITQKYGRSVTRAVEYSCNDFGLYQVASGLGKTADAQKYLTRSRNWRNHWDATATALNFSGFLVPRTLTAFVAQDPLQCGGCYWGEDYYEALPWEYSFNAHHDVNALIQYAGGDDLFAQRLATTFVPGLRPSGSEPFGNTIFNPGNEPSFTTPDAGAMESWLLWSMLGLYPMTGQTTFLIGSPWFADLTLKLDGGGTLHITTTTTTTTTALDNRDDDAGAAAPPLYVQSLALNGQPWNQSWVTYDDVFAKGARLAFVLGPAPSNWSVAGPRPPSPATEADTAAIPPPLTPPLSSHGGYGTDEDNEDGGSRVSKAVVVLLVAALFGLAVLGAAIAAVLLARRRRRIQQQRSKGDAADEGDTPIWLRPLRRHRQPRRRATNPAAEDEVVDESSDEALGSSPDKAGSGSDVLDSTSDSASDSDEQLAVREDEAAAVPETAALMPSAGGARPGVGKAHASGVADV